MLPRCRSDACASGSFHECVGGSLCVGRLLMHSQGQVRHPGHLGELQGQRQAAIDAHCGRHRHSH